LPASKGKKKEQPYVEFSNAVEKAMAEAEVAGVNAIVVAAARHWQAAAWMLERKHPERWGRRPAMVFQPDGGPVTGVLVVPGKVTEEEWQDEVQSYLDSQPTGDSDDNEPG
jgi:hypothetical protein